MAKLKAQPSIYAYFLKRLKQQPRDRSLLELEVASHCGKMCKKVIDRAAKLRQVSDPGAYGDILHAANTAVEIYWRG